MAALYLVAGSAHLLLPAPFLAIMPHWVPWPRAVILVTGLCEIAGAAALMSTRLRWFAGVALAVYALCVYPANVQHAINDLGSADGGHAGWWYHAPRLASSRSSSGGRYSPATSPTGRFDALARADEGQQGGRQPAAGGDVEAMRLAVISQGC